MYVYVYVLRIVHTYMYLCTMQISIIYLVVKTWARGHYDI